MVIVWTNCSVTNASASQDGLEICAMKTLMIVLEALLIQVILPTLVKMEDNVLIRLMTLSANAYLDLLARSVSTTSISVKGTHVRMEEPARAVV